MADILLRSPASESICKERGRERKKRESRVGPHLSSHERSRGVVGGGCRGDGDAGSSCSKSANQKDGSESRVVINFLQTLRSKYL